MAKNHEEVVKQEIREIKSRMGDGRNLIALQQAITEMAELKAKIGDWWNKSNARSDERLYYDTDGELNALYNVQRRAMVII